MTSKASAILAIAALMLVGPSAFAQSVGISKPVVAKAGSDTRFAVPHVRDCLGEFDIASVDAGNSTITLNSDPGALSAGKCYVRVLDGALAGEWFTISAKSGTTLTLVEGVNTSTSPADLTGLANTDSVLVCKHWTLATIFPPNLAGLSFPAIENVANIGSRTYTLLLPDNESGGINKSLTGGSFIFINDPANSFVGWFTTGGQPADDVVIAPQGTMVVRNEANASTGDPDDTATVIDESTGDLTLYAAGERRDVKRIARIPTFASDNDYRVQPAQGLPITLGESGLFTSGVVRPETDVTQLPAPDTVLLYDNSKVGINKAFDGGSFFYANDPGNGFVGWFTTGGQPADDVVLDGGEVIVIRRSGTSAGEVEWVQDPANPAP